MNETCDRCGAVLTPGEWPWCPHGRSALVTVPDDIPGGMILYNMGHTPVTVYSHSERKRLAEARGLTNVVCHVDGDRHVGRMV